MSVVIEGVLGNKEASQMNNKMVMEVVTFRANSGINVKEMSDAAQAINPWLETQPGFISRRLGINHDGNWIEVISWRNMESAEAASANMMRAEGAGAFMDAIDKSSITMHHYDVVVAL